MRSILHVYAYLVVSVAQRLVEVKERMGPEANGGDYWMVERTVLVRLCMGKTKLCLYTASTHEIGNETCW
jgi:hypothetical protein